MNNKNTTIKSDIVSTILILSLFAIIFGLGYAIPVKNRPDRYEACFSVTENQKNCECWVNDNCPTNYSPGKTDNNDQN